MSAPKRPSEPELPERVIEYLRQLTADRRSEMEALFRAALFESRRLGVIDLWEQRELATSFWILLTTGVNQDHEMEIAKALLFWKSFFTQDAAQVKCIQTSQRREFGCCTSRFRAVTCPTVVFGDCPNMSSFLKVGPQLLFVLSSKKGALERLFSTMHRLVEDGKSVREVGHYLRSASCWSSLNINYNEVQNAIEQSIMLHPEISDTASGALVRPAWTTSDPAALLELIDRDAPELNEILSAARRALGSGFGDVLQSRADAVSEIARAIYEAARSTDIQYDFEPASPGRTHQEVRLAGEVIRGKAATCLDLALLYAALLERAHLSPAVILVARSEGWHAMAGFFGAIGTRTRVPSSIVVLRDTGVVHEMVRQANLTVVETTGLSAIRGEKLSFESACIEGEGNLANANLLGVVDVLAGRVVRPD